jgi:exosortase
VLSWPQDAQDARIRSIDGSSHEETTSGKSHLAMATEIRSFQSFRESDQFAPVAILTGLSALLIISYWNTLVVISTAWATPEYSHGWLIPLFSGVLLWLRREPIEAAPPAAQAAGVGLLAFGLAARLVGAYVGVPLIDMWSLLPCLFGIFLLVGGWKLLKWSGPAIGFLVFMYPLPGYVERHLLQPLQHVATVASTYALQTLGVAAYREGTTLKIGEQSLSVAEQCSGLRMSTILLALAVAVVLLSQHRPWWERAVVLVTAVPIALLVNVIRITVTALFVIMLHDNESPAEAIDFVHNVAGYVMPVLALGFMFLELVILSNLFLDVEEEQTPMPVGVGVGALGTKGTRGSRL